MGITEAQASAEQRPIRVYRVAFCRDRPRPHRRPNRRLRQGRRDPSGKILGATVVGEDASMIIQEFVLAMRRTWAWATSPRPFPIYPTYAGVVGTTWPTSIGRPGWKAATSRRRLEAVLRLPPSWPSGNGAGVHAGQASPEEPHPVGSPLTLTSQLSAGNCRRPCFSLNWHPNVTCCRYGSSVLARCLFALLACCSMPTTDDVIAMPSEQVRAANRAVRSARSSFG